MLDIMNVKKTKVCFFIPSLSVGGAEKMLIKLANNFSYREDLSVYFIIIKKGVLVKDLRLENIKLINLNKSKISSSILALAKALKEIQPDTILSALGHANVAVVMARIISGVQSRVVISERSTVSNAPVFSSSIKGKVHKNLYRFFYLKSDKIIAISNGVKEDLVKTLKIPRKKISVIYNPAYPEYLDNIVPIGRSELSPYEDDKILISVGRLEKAKDFMTLLKAVNIIKDKNIHLFILGEGKCRGELERYINDNKLSNKVTLQGFVEEPCTWLKAADIYICSSAWEGFGNAIVEAMACGLPVIATNCPGPKEILNNLTDTVPVGDEKSMADAIVDALYMNKTDRFQKRAKEFTIEKISNEYLDVLLHGVTKRK